MYPLICAAAGIGFAALYYAFNKRMTVGLVDNSGLAYEVVFKRSVLEGVNLDENSAGQACDILQWLMDNTRPGGAGGTSGAVQMGNI